jgi:creatinine amidohydrolase
MLRRWGEMTSAELATLADPVVAILPVAATEQHGPHLPTGTDAAILQAILERAVRRGGTLRAVSLPLQAIGWSSEHGDFPGTLSLPADLLASAWTVLGSAVAKLGLKRLLILNSHGGNPPAIGLAAMRLRTEHGLFVAQTHWEALARPAEIAPAGATGPDWHAGWIETSVMLHLRPELVAMDKARAGALRRIDGLPPDGPAPWAWMTGDLSPNGVIGDPRPATAELGRQLVERTVDGLAGLLAKIAAAPWPPRAE